MNCVGRSGKAVYPRINKKERKKGGAGIVNFPLFLLSFLDSSWKKKKEERRIYGGSETVCRAQ